MRKFKAGDTVQVKKKCKSILGYPVKPGNYTIIDAWDDGDVAIRPGGYVVNSDHIVSVDEKSCLSCHKKKPLSNFHRDCNSNDGHRHECAACRNAKPKKKGFGTVTAALESYVNDITGDEEAPQDTTVLPPKLDPVNAPQHYTHLNPEPLDVILKWKLDFCEGNIVKYLARWRHKNGLEDLYKARVYLERLIKEEEKREFPF